MTITFEHHAQFDNTNDGEKTTVLAFIFSSLENTDNALSKAQLKQAISKGALWLTRKKHTQRLRRVKKPLLQGDELHFYYNEALLASKVKDAILISDEIDYSVWYKPFGMLSQGSKWSDHCTISRFAQQYFTPERSVFIVHRLDKAATGLILIAHSKKAARALSTMFEVRTSQNNMLEKHYQIIVHGDYSKNEQPQIITTDVDDKSARSTFTCIAYDKTKNQSLIKVKIDSGRKHQIRIHAASIGFPIVGDRLHGIADEREIQNLQLCAVDLSFICPLSIDKESVSKEPGVTKQFELADELKPHFSN
jgi:tRNA pseudouridine32 synthase/23S rRNA pseudouridine746 synthase